MDRTAGEIIMAFTNTLTIARNNQTSDPLTFLMLRATLSGLISALKSLAEEGKCPPIEVEHCEKMFKNLYIAEEMRDLCDNV